MSENKNNGFSSRVLNMKFMRKAEVADKLELLSKKLLDLSEWKLPNLSSKTKLKLVSKPKIKKVGYASIMNEESEMVSNENVAGRKKWGEPEKLDIEDEVDSENTKRPNKSQKESKEFFDKLWKNQRKEDDSILDSLHGGISGAGSSAAPKRKFNENHANNNANKKKRTR